MHKPIGLTILEDYAQKFLDATDAWCEPDYGISDRDAQRGTMAVLRACGHIDAEFVEAIEAYWKWQKEDEERKRQEREEARRASLTPEQREREDVFQRMFDSLGAMMKPSREAFIISTLLGPDKMGIE